MRLHGFSEREIAVVRALMMSEIESAYLERDQMQSTSLRDEYLQVCESTVDGYQIYTLHFIVYHVNFFLNFYCMLQHFFRKDPVVGIEYEAQLQKSILPRKYI